MRFVDSHCHLDDPRFEPDRAEVIERALAAGVETMLAVGTGNGPPDLEVAIRLADKWPQMYATAGIHPHDAAKANGDSLKRVAELLSHPKVVAMGEIGLDYHYDFSPRDVQRSVFAGQLDIAAEARKPVIIHTREAWDDTMHLLEEHWAHRGVPGVMHCFSGGPEEARRCIEMGFYISFAGVVTFPKATAIQEAAKVTPLDRLLIETDAPYLAPVPHRGKRNEPAFVIDTARKLSELRGEPVEVIAKATTENFNSMCLRHSNANG